MEVTSGIHGWLPCMGLLFHLLTPYSPAVLTFPKPLLPFSLLPHHFLFPAFLGCNASLLDTPALLADATAPLYPGGLERVGKEHQDLVGL